MVPSSLNFKRFSMSSSVGPLGGKYGNALFTSTSDLFNLDQCTIDAIKVVGGPRMTESLDLLLNSKEILR